MAAAHPDVTDARQQKSAAPSAHETVPNPFHCMPPSPADKADQAGSSDRPLVGGLKFAEATTATMGPKASPAKRADMLTLRPRILIGSRVSCIKEEIPVRAMILPDGQVFVSPQVRSGGSGHQAAAAADAEWVRKLRGDVSAALKHKRLCFFDVSTASVGGPAPKPWGEVKLSKAIRRTPPGDKGLLIRGSSGKTYGRTGDRLCPSPPSSTYGETNNEAKEAMPQQGGLQGIHVAQFIFPVRTASASTSSGQTQPSSTTATETAEQAYATESYIITFDLQNLDTIPPAIRGEAMRNIEKYMSNTVTRILTHKFAALHTEWRRSNGGAKQSDTDKTGTDGAIVGDDGEAEEPGKKYRCLLAVAKGSLYFDSEACAYLSGVKALGADGKVAELSALVDDLRIRQTTVAGGSAGIDGDDKKKDVEQARMLRYECAGTVTRWRGKTNDEAVA